jgi:oxalate decarboxylase/phosphoglucose isomerase-like protein (cupin superfamily)
MDRPKHHHHPHYDGHEHTHDEDHDHFQIAHNAAHGHGHAHGEPTGNAVEKIRFTRSQFLRMCLAGVAAGAAAANVGTSSHAQAARASRPGTDSYDDPFVFNGPSAYRQFLKKEGIPVYEGGAIDVNKVELKPWKRVGALGAYIFLEGTVDAWVCQIPPGAQTTAVRHIFEEQILILAGKGRTQFWQSDPKQMHTLEWERGAVFPSPLNVWHRHINTGKEPVRMVAITNAPLLIDMFRHTDFIFNNDYVFTERFDGRSDYFSSKPTHVYPTVERDRSGKGGYKGHHTHSIVNYVPNVWNVQLYPAGQGVEDYDNHLAMARNTMACHVEQFPTGTYERCHRHGPGSTIILLDGSGFSLMWQPEMGTTPFRDGKEHQVQSTDWKEGTLLVPPLQWYHQHFNNGKVPARFIKLGGWNNDLYPFTTTLVSDPFRTEIDYPDEDPRVREIFRERLAAAGGEFKMPENVFKR